jgi:hypothetical protein
MINKILPRLIIISIFGEVNNLNSRIYKIDKAFNTATTFVTANFSHATKKYKDKGDVKIDSRITTVQLSVPSYCNNLSVSRLFSHLVFSYKLKNYLKHLNQRPDIIICSMPTSTAAYFAGRYCKKYKIQFVVDVIDLWPESLIPVTNYKKTVNILTHPWRLITHKAYKLATYISGESKSYAMAARNINPQVPWSYTYLGVDVAQTTKLVNQSKIELKKPVDEIWICYGGSLGNSYDFDSVLDSIKFLHNKNIKYRMFFVGDGEKRVAIKKFADDHKLKIEITGRLEYMDYLKYLSFCDIGINSFAEGSLVAHSFKFNDYVASKMFIMNNLVGETAEMIDNYKIGLNFNKENLSYLLSNVCENWDKYHEYKINIDRLITDELDTEIIYKKLAQNILLKTN